MRVFTSLLPPQEARARYLAALAPSPLGAETVDLADALDRVLAGDIVAAEDLPPFERSTVDGYAVRAADFPGGVDQPPARLRLIGAVRMGESTTLTLGAGEAARVPTGGMLPSEADAVVMQEHASAEGDTLLVRRPVAAGENIIGRGEDVRVGDPVLRAGRRLRPADLGILAGLGQTRVLVRVRPRVAVLSSGDEVVTPDRSPGPGQVRDMNASTLGALVRRAGGVPATFPILPDELPAVRTALARALRDHDLVLISGGSSVGERDVVVDAIQAAGPPGIVVHGVAVRPGKPTVLGAAGRRPVIGLPGNPVSAMVIFDLFVRPVIAGLLGAEDAGFGGQVAARLARALAAPAEREDHVRVALERRDGGLWAQPLPAKSGVLTSMVRADGIVVVSAGGRVAKGEVVEVRLLEG